MLIMLNEQRRFEYDDKNYRALNGTSQKEGLLKVVPVSKKISPKHFFYSASFTQRKPTVLFRSKPCDKRSNI